jgi:hypothetical protein
LVNLGGRPIVPSRSLAFTTVSMRDMSSIVLKASGVHPAAVHPSRHLQRLHFKRIVALDNNFPRGC